MYSTDAKVKRRWIYTNESTADRPGDLGYYIGYRIMRAYYRGHPDERRAIRDILDVADSAAFLAASGYAPR
jgi:hypothetical protein